MFNVRESVEHCRHMLRDKEYPTPLPEELVPYHVWLQDCGHNILCVLSQHMEDAKKLGISEYEVPVPVKYVLEKGYKVHEDCIEVEADYDSTFGVTVPEGYDEW